MKFQLSAISICIMLAAFSVTVSTDDLTDGVIGYWPLDGDATDSSGNGNDGTLVGKPEWVEGAPGLAQALSFSGQGDHVTLETGPALNGPTDFTLSLWVKTTSDGAHSLLQQRNGGFNGEYVFSVGTSHNTAMNPGQVYFTVYNGAFQWEIWSTGTINDGEWHHVAGVRNGETGTVYIDGEPDGTATNTVLDLVDTLKVAIGGDIRNSTRYFKGEIDEVLIYNRALEPDEVKALARGGNLFVVWSSGKLTTAWGDIKR